MDILRFLRRPAPSSIPPVPVQTVTGAYPWTSYPRGRRPSDAEVDAIMAKYETAPKPTRVEA